MDRFVESLTQLGVARGDKLGLAVSGGSDSIALLSLAVAVQDRLDLRLHVLHVDHALRPGSAADAAFVAASCAEQGLPWTILRAPARSPSEADARDVRYRVIGSAARELECRWVATAHTQDDQAETVLLRLLRGTTVDGLAGIPCVRGPYIRPLLGRRRSELRGWLRSQSIPWREDPSNADPRYDRNWVRHELIPLLEARRPGRTASLARLASAARADALALGALAERAERRHVRGIGDVRVFGDGLLGEPDAVRHRVLVRAGCPPSLVEGVDRLRPGRRIRAGDVEVWRLASGLAVVPRAIEVPAPARLVDGATDRHWGVRTSIGAPATVTGTWRCTLNALPDAELWLRSRRPGDRVRTSAGTRKVQDVLVDAKIPRFARDLVPVLTVDGGPVAVVGLTVPPEDGRLGVGVSPLGACWWTKPS